MITAAQKNPATFSLHLNTAVTGKCTRAECSRRKTWMCALPAECLRKLTMLQIIYYIVSQKALYVPDIASHRLYNCITIFNLLFIILLDILQKVNELQAVYL